MNRDVSGEIFKHRTRANSLEAMANKQNTKMCKWVNKWMVPLLVVFITLAAIAIVAFVSFAVCLLR